MKVTVFKNEGESNERLITRFTKKVQSSRKLLKIRSERYWQRPKKKSYQRVAAIMREKHRAVREKNRFY